MRQHDVVKKERLLPKVNVFKIYVKFHCGRPEKKLLQLKRITDRVLGAGFPAAGGFEQFFENSYNFLQNSYFNAIWITFASFVVI